MNSYRAHISLHKRNQLLKCFINEVVATQAAKSCKISRNTANLYYRYFRQSIFDHQQRHLHEQFSGEVEADHTFFGAKGKRRFKKKNGKIVLIPRQKFLVFGFLERQEGGQHLVRTYPIKRATSEALMPLFRLVVANGARIYTDSWRSFNALKADGYLHQSVNHRKKQFSKKDGAYEVHTGTIDRYFGWAKGRLAKFCRLHPSTLLLHLKECEFRYIHRHDLEEALKTILKD